MFNRMCVMNKSTMTRLSYNTNNGAGTKWNQYGGTGITLNADIKARVTKDGWGGGVSNEVGEMDVDANWR